MSFFLFYFHEILSILEGNQGLGNTHFYREFVQLFCREFIALQNDILK